MTADELRAFRTFVETVNEIDVPETLTWTSGYKEVARVFGEDAARTLKKDLEERGEGQIGEIHFRLMQ